MISVKMRPSQFPRISLVSGQQVLQNGDPHGQSYSFTSNRLRDLKCDLVVDELKKHQRHFILLGDLICTRFWSEMYRLITLV